MKIKMETLLLELIEKANQLQEKTIDPAFQTKEASEKWVNSLKNKVRDEKINYENKKNSLKEDAQIIWEEAKNNFEQGVVKVQEDFRKLKYDPNSGTPQLRASWAEDDTILALYIALNALTNVEELLIIALKERAKIDPL